MATHFSILGWKIPWTEDPGRLQSMGSQTVRHDLACMPRSTSFVTVSRVGFEKVANSLALTWPYNIKVVVRVKMG